MITFVSPSSWMSWLEIQIHYETEEKFAKMLQFLDSLNPLDVVEVKASSTSAAIITKLFGNITRPGYTSFAHGFNWYGNEATTIFGNLREIAHTDPHLIFTFGYSK